MEIETVIKSIPVRYWTRWLQEEMTPILHNLLKTTQRETILPNSSYIANITLILKPERDTTDKYKLKFLMNRQMQNSYIK